MGKCHISGLELTALLGRVKSFHTKGVKSRFAIMAALLLRLMHAVFRIMPNTNVYISVCISVCVCFMSSLGVDIFVLACMCI